MQSSTLVPTRARAFVFFWGLMPGLDALRVLATTLVTLQHALTISGWAGWDSIGALNVGQLGVAVFFALSGFLAGRSQPPAGPWLWRRLYRLYPAYWLAMAASFALTWLSGYKTFGATQVASQMLGTGLFTHRSSLVNVPTWFVSMLLVAYGLWALVALTGRFKAHAAVALALGLAAGVARGVNWPWFHLLTFAAAGAAGAAAGPRRTSLVLAAVAAAALALVPVRSDFAYAALSLAGVASVVELSWTSSWLALAADYSYEYYLLHGIALVGCVRILGLPPLVGIPAGVAVASVGALALGRVTQTLTGPAARVRAASGRYQTATTA